jgi:hypothetical protein
MIESRSRRCSPQSLRQSPYHRATWDVRPLSFCPESTELLISCCPVCHGKLGWRRTAGLERCEHCRGSLLEYHPARLPPNLVDDARTISGLVSVSESERQAALEKLPEPFRSWGPIPVFEAIVQLADVCAFAGRRDIVTDHHRQQTNAKTMDARHLVRGLDILTTWPDGLASLVRDLWAAATVLGSSVTLRAWAGPLARSVRHIATQRPIDLQLAADFPFAIIDANIPVRANTLRETAEVRRKSKVTLKAAGQSVGVASKTLRRLDSAGDAVVARDRLIKLYDRDALNASVAVYRSAETDVTCSAQLGVPAYCLPQLAALGLLDPVIDHDALLLANGASLYTKDSRKRFEADLADGSVMRASDTPLDRALLFVLAPNAWATMLSAIRRNEIHFSRQPNGKTPVEQLCIDAGEADQILANSDLSAFPADAAVPALMAGRMLGIGDVMVGKLIEAGLLRASRGPRRHQVAVHSLATFAREMVGAPELAWRTGTSRWDVAKLLTEIAPTATVYRRNLWSRKLAEEALGLPPMPAIQALEHARI